MLSNWEVLWAQMPRLPGVTVWAPLEMGWRLCSAFGQGCWLGSLPEHDYSMDSSPAQVLWPGLLVRQGWRPMPSSCVELPTCFTIWVGP